MNNQDNNRTPKQDLGSRQQPQDPNAGKSAGEGDRKAKKDAPAGGMRSPSDTPRH